MAKKLNTLDLLLGVDAGVIEKPKKDVKINSLSRALKKDVYFTVQGLGGNEFDKVQESAMTIKGKDIDINMGDMQVFTILEGVVEPNLKSKELREHYGVPTPKELVKKLLLSGEITKLYTEITELSGFGNDMVDDIKN